MASNMPNFVSRLFRPFTSSSSLSVVPGETGTAATSASGFPEGAEKCTVAAGCFWGVEHIFRKKFGNGGGVLDAQVGYIGGEMEQPDYRKVCRGDTGHAEALQMTFDPSIVSYRSLIEFFYKMHDPTTKNRQGGDSGTQYRSAIFYHSPEQENIAREVTAKVQAQWWTGGKVSTEIAQAAKWWDAETYHQKYLLKNSGGYECPAHFVRTFPALT